MITSLIATRRPDFVAAAGFLVGALREVEIGFVIERAGASLLEVFTRSSCELALLFLSGLRREAAAPPALSIFRGLQPACCGDSELLGLFLRAGAAVLGPAIQPVICEMAEHLTTPTAIGAACAVLAATLKQECAAMRVITPASLMPLIAAFLPASMEDPVTLPFLDFAGALFAVAAPPLEMVQPVCELARRVCDLRYESPAAMRTCAGFVNGLARGWPAVAEELFSGALLNAVFAEGFCPLAENWEVYIEKVHVVHQALLRVDPDGFGAVFVGAVAGFGAGEDFAARYLLKGESIGGAKKHAKCRALFQELLEAFWAMQL
jgi:hypothetical protein